MYPALFIIVELGFVFTQLSPSPYLFTSNVSSIRYSGLLLLCTRAGSVYRNLIVLSYCNDMLMGGALGRNAFSILAKMQESWSKVGHATRSVFSVTFF